MTVRLDTAARKKLERFAAREGLSMNQALNELVRRASDQGGGTPTRPRYRLKPRKVAFGFDIARAKLLAAELANQGVASRLRGEREAR